LDINWLKKGSIAELQRKEIVCILLRVRKEVAQAEIEIKRLLRRFEEEERSNTSELPIRQGHAGRGSLSLEPNQGKSPGGLLGEL